MKDWFEVLENQALRIMRRSATSVMHAATGDRGYCDIWEDFTDS